MYRLRRSLVLRIVISCLIVLPFFAALDALWFGKSGSSIVIGAIVAFVLPLGRYRARLRLNRADRRTVDDVIDTGLPSGRPDLDEIARDHLATYAAWTPGRADRIVTAIFGLLVVIVPVFAAFARSPWWLLALVPTPLLWFARRTAPEVPAQERLRILLADGTHLGA